MNFFWVALPTPVPTDQDPSRKVVIADITTAGADNMSTLISTGIVGGIDLPSSPRSATALVVRWDLA